MKKKDTFSFIFAVKWGVLRMSKLESEFQRKFIKKVKETFPGCVVLKNDPNYIQGFPDLTIFNGDKWAVLEVKREEKAGRRPNQEYYVDILNTMSYSNFVYPENEELVMSDLKDLFQK